MTPPKETLRTEYHICGVWHFCFSDLCRSKRSCWKSWVWWISRLLSSPARLPGSRWKMNTTQGTFSKTIACHMFFWACRQTYVMNDFRRLRMTLERGKEAWRRTFIPSHPFYLLCTRQISPEAAHPHSRALLVLCSRVPYVCMCVSAIILRNTYFTLIAACIHPLEGELPGWIFDMLFAADSLRIISSPLLWKLLRSRLLAIAVATCGWAAAAGIPPLTYLFFIFCSVIWQPLLLNVSRAGSQPCRRCSSTSSSRPRR